MPNGLSLSQIEKEEFSFTSLKEELQNNLVLVKRLRKKGYLTTLFKGYDIIRDVFFCEECIFVEDEWEDSYEFELLFSTFANYMEYVNDVQLLAINACYYQCTTVRCEIDRLPKEIQPIIENIIVDCAFVPSIDYQMEDILSLYTETQKAEFEKQNIIHAELTERCDALRKALMDETQFQKIFVDCVQYLRRLTYPFDDQPCMCYIFQQICPEDKQSNIPHVLFNMVEKGIIDIRNVYHIIPFYSQELLLRLYKDKPTYSEATLKKHKREFTRAVNAFYECPSPELDHFSYNETTTLFTCRQDYHFKGKLVWPRIISFCTLEEMEQLANRDLHDVVDGPIMTSNKSQYEVETRKEYKKEQSNDGLFVVTQLLFDGEDCIHEHIFETKYLFDLIYYLNYDLSDIDLILCDGLDNVKQFTNISLTNASMQSKHAQKFGLQVERHPFLNNTIEMTPILNNEVAVVEPEYIEPYNEDNRALKIKYISDLHLIHRITESFCVSTEDIIYLFTQISKEIAPLSDEILVVAGDTSSDLELLKLFTEVLDKYCDGHVIFVLGNHELWCLRDKQQPNSLFNDYQEWFESFYHQSLLQNNILYLDDTYTIKHISEETLQKCDIATIDNELKTARCVFFGGVAFAGKNEQYNADIGLYQNVITRQEECQYSQQFADLYHKLLPILHRHPSIVATHMPLNDWDSSFYSDNIFYISGHTHRNFFYDDGVLKIYSDNQIGYKKKKITAKYFYLNPVYDFFQDLPDGIHEISREDYTQFMRGRNIHITFSRDINKLYAIKKMGYYCFIHKNKKGRLSILNGGALKHISEKTVQAVYDKMDIMISRINGPLTQYSNLQKQVSMAVQNIGGDGTIHGCIVDIDFYSHLFVLPNGQVIPYYAYSMVHKVVFPSLQQLLQEHTPTLHAKYLKMIEGTQDKMLPANFQATSPVLYLDTEIYRVSREIKKMQRLTAGVLSYWDDAMLSQQDTFALPPIVLEEQ